MAKDKLNQIKMKTKKETTKTVAKPAKTIKVPVVTKAEALQAKFNDLESVHNLAKRMIEGKEQEIKQLQEKNRGLVLEINSKINLIEASQKRAYVRDQQIIDLQEWKTRAQDVIVKLHKDKENLESQIRTQANTIKDLNTPKPNWFQRLFLVLSVMFIAAGTSFAQTPFHNVNKITIENHKQFLPDGFKSYADTAGIKSYQDESGNKIVFIFHKNKLNKVYTFSESLLPSLAWKYPYQYKDGESKVYTTLDYVLSETKDRGLTKWTYHSTNMVDSKIAFSKFYHHKGN